MQSLSSPPRAAAASSFFSTPLACSLSSMHAPRPSLFISASSAGAPTQRLAGAPFNCCRRRCRLGLRSTSSTSTSSSPSPILSVCRAGLKLTESFDAHLYIDDNEKREALFSRLSDPNFCAQVSLETTRATKRVEFTGKVFTPVPWSPSTPKGMPAEYEEFAEDTDNYIVINVPPTLTFKANVLGKRVCAIYKKVGDAE